MGIGQCKYYREHVDNQCVCGHPYCIKYKVSSLPDKPKGEK